MNFRNKIRAACKLKKKKKLRSCFLFGEPPKKIIPAKYPNYGPRP